MGVVASGGRDLSGLPGAGAVGGLVQAPPGHPLCPSVGFCRDRSGAAGYGAGCPPGGGGRGRGQAPAWPPAGVGSEVHA